MLQESLVPTGEVPAPAMCSPATCRRCGKITYTGCGRHVDRILAGVPADRRCTCR